MIITIKSWKKLFLFCFGVAAAAAFCMKWMEADLWSREEKFTILGLELFYSKEKVVDVLSGLDIRVRTILRYHLSFDFAFMAGVYPGIAALCVIARTKITHSFLKKLLYVLVILQLAGWAADCAENFYLFKWTNKPVIGDEFSTYHFVVIFKWIVALAGALLSIPLALRKSKGG